MNEGFERYRRRHIKTYVCHLRSSLGALPFGSCCALNDRVVAVFAFQSPPVATPSFVSRASVDDNGKCPPSGHGEHKGPLFARLDNGHRSHTVATCHGGEAARCLVVLVLVLRACAWAWACACAALLCFFLSNGSNIRRLLPCPHLTLVQGHEEQ